MGRAQAARPLGAQVVCRARVIYADGPPISFQFEAHDEHEKIAGGAQAAFDPGRCSFALTGAYRSTTEKKTTNRSPMRNHCNVVLSALIFLAILPVSAENLREWTNQDARTIRTELLSVEESSVTLKTENGQEFQVPLAILSESDAAYARQWAADLQAAGDRTVFPASSMKPPLYSV